MGSTVVIGWGLGLALLVLVAIAPPWPWRVDSGGAGRRVGTAAVRAVAQLAVVSAVIVAVVRSLWLSLAFVLVMLVIAGATSARRMTGDRSGLFAVVPIGVGPLVVLGVVVGTGAVPPVGIALVPVSGIPLDGR
jgi:putative ABC transport system permease protein